MIKAWELFPNFSPNSYVKRIFYRLLKLLRKDFSSTKSILSKSTFCTKIGLKTECVVCELWAVKAKLPASEFEFREN